MTKQQSPNAASSGLEVELVFDADQVVSPWYHPELAPVLCALCGKNCKVKCVNVNPYCG
jgi:hypothetical protein